MTTKVKADAIVMRLSQSVIGGDRHALSRAITLVESTRAADREPAETLLTTLLPHTGSAIRIGISGAPGVGKSTFIEALGTHLTGQGKTLAVLAVDPSSPRSGGSILGDKTRMGTLARNPRAFIRPSPAGVAVGGIAHGTRQAMLVAEAAGFDMVLVETVGVGQSETAVADMVDLFVLLVAPGGGDELQGIKRGVTELADIVLITKADGEFKQAAARAAGEYAQALHLMRPKYTGLPPRVLQVSAMTGIGVGNSCEAIVEFHRILGSSGQLAKLREAQLRRWFWREVQALLLEEVKVDATASFHAHKGEIAVARGKVLPAAAARIFLSGLRGS